MKLKKYTSLLLAAVLLFTLAACNTNGNIQEADAPTDSQPLVDADTSVLFSEELLDINFDESVLAEAAEYPAGRAIFAYSNGRVYYERYTDVRDMNDTVTGEIMEILSAGLDGTDERVMWSHEVFFDPSAPVEVYETIHAFSVDDADNLWIIIRYETVDETIDYEEEEISPFTYMMFKYGADGALLASFDFSSFDEPVQPMLSIAFDASGNACIQCAMDSRGAAFVFSGETAEPIMRGAEEQSLYSIVQTADGRVAYVAYRFDTRRNAFVTLETTGVPGDTPEGVSLAQPPETEYRYDGGKRTTYIYSGAGEWDIFFSDEIESGAVYGYDFETGREQLIIDFVKSDISLAPTSFGGVIPLGGLIALSDTEFLISKAGDGLYKLTHDPNKILDKTMLTLAVTTPDMMLSAAVQEFNRQSDTSRIEVIDYSTYSDSGDYAQAALYLDMDILAGDAPDIIYLGRLSPEKYISKGLLADLTELLNSDPDVAREDLFENILALGEQDGRLYHVMTHFYVRTLVGKESIFGDGGITMEQISTVLEQYPDSEVMSEYSSLDWAWVCTAFMMDEFVDWESATCDFNSEEFISMLRFAKRLPSDVDYDWENTEEAFMPYFTDYKEKFADDRLLLNLTILFAPRSARALTDILGDDGAYLGFPSSGGGGVADRLLDFGISASSEHKEEAWEFISMLMQDDYNGYSTGLPINRAAFERQLAEEMIPLTERNFTRGLVLSRSTGVRSYYWVISTAKQARAPENADYHLTEHEAALLRSVVENTTETFSTEAGILAIVAEEADMYLNGARSAEETAKIIQSRASIYVSENS